jgi:lipoic acid synthetase
MRGLKLNTVCEEAHCPNIGECWHHGTATFMILGDVCTRACAYCAVAHGRPNELDLAEPARVADAIARMALRHAVITSVDRDDLADGGAEHFAKTIAAIRAGAPGCKVEVLIPDFKGDRAALETVLAASPDVLNHNLETVERLQREVRKAGRSRVIYQRFGYHPHATLRTQLLEPAAFPRSRMAGSAGYPREINVSHR